MVERQLTARSRGQTEVRKLALSIARAAVDCSYRIDLPSLFRHAQNEVPRWWPR